MSGDKYFEVGLGTLLAFSPSLLVSLHTTAPGFYSVVDPVTLEAVERRVRLRLRAVFFIF